MRTRQPLLLLGAVLVLLGVGAAVWVWPSGDAGGPVGEASPHAKQTDPIVFIVLDNVRADRLSLCGHDRPTSPHLDALAAGSVSSCQAYVPAPWTLPTHATYFTGLEVPEHGAIFSGRTDPLVFDLKARPLGPEAPTLAEELGARGYRTALVSGNPVVGEVSGLTRGFASVHHALGFGKGFGDGLMELLEAGLADLRAQGDGPAFLFVNIADAHVPWRPVPDGLSWVPARPRLPKGRRPEAPVGQLLRGDLPPTEEAALVAHMQDIYDHAVFRADETLGRVLERLEAEGLLGGRVVITSDHGELLGEHRTVGHCCVTSEPIARVPLVVRGIDALQLPSPVAASVVHGLVRDGALPEPLPEVRMAAEPNPSWAKWDLDFGRATEVAAWDGSRKHVWRDDGTVVFDLAADPGEQAPTPAAAPEELATFAARVQAALARDVTDGDDLEDRLEALGYVE